MGLYFGDNNSRAVCLGDQERTNNCWHCVSTNEGLESRTKEVYLIVAPNPIIR